MNKFLRIRTYAILLIWFLNLIPTSTQADTSPLFTDVPLSDPARDYIETAWIRGMLTPGTSVGSYFYPNKTLVRAEVASDILVALDKSPYSYYKYTWQFKGANYPSWWAGQFSSSQSGQALDDLKKVNANYVSIVPTWYMTDRYSNTIYADSQKTPSDADINKAIDDAKARGLKVMLKPHVDVWNAPGGVWRGNIAPTNPTVWFSSYQNFINHYAQIAKNKNVELFDIGTELTSMQEVNYQTNWEQIIAGIRNIYSGKLIYSANWNACPTVSFWNKLDYLGIDAYFPLSDLPDPTVEQLMGGWTNYQGSYGTHNWVSELYQCWSQAVSSAPSSPLGGMIFTEIGYYNADYAAKEPWKLNSSNLNNSLQAKAYEALFKIFANRFPFLGAFFWHWEVKPSNQINPDTIQFTPQAKPAETTIRDWYLKLSPTFDDVPENHSYYADIERIFQLGIMSGCWYDPATGHRRFCPNDPVTRAQMAVILSRAAQIAPYDNPVPTFSDVPKTYWAYKYIEGLYKAGITKGCATNPLKFCPSEAVTKRQAAIFYVRAFKIPFLPYPPFPLSPQVAYSPGGSVTPGTTIYSPDGKYFAKEIRDADGYYHHGLIGLFDKTTGNLIHTFDVSAGIWNDVKGLAWSPNSQKIAVMYHGGFNNGTWLLDIPSKTAYRPAGHFSGTERCAFLHGMRFLNDSTLIYSCSGYSNAQHVDAIYKIP